MCSQDQAVRAVLGADGHLVGAELPCHRCVRRPPRRPELHVVLPSLEHPGSATWREPHARAVDRASQPRGRPWRPAPWVRCPCFLLAWTAYSSPPAHARPQEPAGDLGREDTWTLRWPSPLSEHTSLLARPACRAESTPGLTAVSRVQRTRRRFPCGGARSP